MWLSIAKPKATNTGTATSSDGQGIPRTHLIIFICNMCQQEGPIYPWVTTANRSSNHQPHPVPITKPKHHERTKWVESDAQANRNISGVPGEEWKGREWSKHCQQTSQCGEINAPKTNYNKCHHNDTNNATQRCPILIHHLGGAGNT